MPAVHRFALEDAPSVAVLMREMAASYGAPIAAERDIAAELVNLPPHIDILVAADDAGQTVGFATCAALYPVGGALAFSYVQQLYVSEAARRLGVARLLMVAAARLARERGHASVEWSTSLANTAAQALYEGLGAVGSAKVSYVLHGAALDRLAAS